MLVDRSIAKIKFNESINTLDDWIYIIGKSGIGKSFFVKCVTENRDILYCEPNHYHEYWKELFNKISEHSRDIIKDLVKDNTINLPKENKLATISDEMIIQLLEEAISKEIQSNQTHISKYLGTYLSDKYDFIVLDNLYRCDYKSYNWMVSLLDRFCGKKGKTVIAICDSDKKWFSHELESDFLTRLSRIKVENYDDSSAYTELINTTVHFDNDEVLYNLSRELYRDFNAKSDKILSLLSIIKRNPDINKLSDQEKLKHIKEKASHLMQEAIENISYLSKEILAVLAIAPVPLSAEVLAYIIDEKEINIHNELNVCLQNDLVERRYNKTSNSTVYNLGGLFSKQLFIDNFQKIHIKYFYEKIFRANYVKLIDIDIFKLLDIAINCDAENTYEIAELCFNIDNTHHQKMQRYAKSLDDFLSYIEDVPVFVCSMYNVNVLYKYGFYRSAYKIICNINDNTYNYLMKKGDIEHLILHPDTALTFELASKVENISISQKLSAINRQIMALTQENKEKLEYARSFYKETLSKYQKNECNGLIELYRNSNNIFGFSEAIEYTIKGYNLAVKLNNNIEKIKILHNLCMLKVLNGCYYEDLNNPNLDVEPDFKMICKEFEEQDEFLHELAYPLLDLGTLEMFEFVKNTKRNTNNLISAKKYYSRAQLYARSFYSKKIADMALLIVNSYLYSSDSEYIVNARNRAFKKYLNEREQIKDFRIHRKILFSLATSASITGHLEEGRNYLLMSKPHVFENETLRYNNLCEDLDIPNEKIDFTPSDLSAVREYHRNSKFVPWLISFGH